MRKSFLLFVILPAIAFAPASNSVNKQLKDFEAFEKVLVSKEGRLDLHQSSDSIYFYLSKLKSNLSEEQNLIDQFKAYSMTLAKLGCGHTQIHPNRSLLTNWVKEEKSLPIDFIMQGRRLFTNKLLSEDFDLINMEGSNNERVRNIKGIYEVLSLDKKSVSEMMNLIAPYISSDEDEISFKYHQVAQLFDFYRHLSDPYSEDSVHISYVKGNDTISTYLNLGRPPINTINARLSASSIEDAKIQKETGTFVVKNSNVGVFRFRSFTACTGKNYDLFLERSFRKIKSKQIKKLVFDLRGNTGGVMQYSLMRYFVGADVDLGRYVVEKPKKGFETVYLKKRNSDYRRHKWMSRVQRFRIWLNDFDNGIVRTDAVDESLIYDGKIIVITDEGTFSAASMLACHLKTLCNAKIVGRPAGGSFYRGNAGTIFAVLPHSKFRLLVNPNTFYSQLEVTSNPFALKQPDQLINPGYIVPRKLDDYYIDVAIEAFQ